MTMPGNILDREYNRFVETPSGDTAVRVSVADVVAVVDYSNDLLNEFDEVLAVNTNTLTTIVSYSVPVGKNLFLSRVESSGTNVATFSVLVGASTIAKKSSYFGGQLNVDFEFYAINAFGLKVTSGQIVYVKVTHERPSQGDFSARISGVLLDE